MNDYILLSSIFTLQDTTLAFVVPSISRFVNHRNNNNNNNRVTEEVPRGSKSWKTSPTLLATVGKKQNEKQITVKKNNNNATDTDTEISTNEQHVQDILDSVSDAEALLACRAYLVKRRRWSTSNEGGDNDDERNNNNKDDTGGWTEWARRRAAQQQNWEDDSTGFFWEDLSQLEYWDPLGSPLRRQTNNSINNNNNSLSMTPDTVGVFEGKRNDDDDGDGDDDIMHSSDTDASTAWVGGDALISLAAWQDAYHDDQSSTLSWEDTEPSPEHLRRSKAARRTFSDSQWKAYWYERRWGSHSTGRRAAEQRLRQRLTSKWQAATQADMLAPLASMTQDEMIQAIVEYASANKKRSQSRQTWARQQAKARQNRMRQTVRPENITVEASIGKTPRDALLAVNVTELEEKKRMRAERARKAYQTRMEKLETDAPSSTNSSLCPSVPPLEALQNIQDALDRGECPAFDWIERVIESSKLPKRKEILLRILKESFDLRGKQWLPIDRQELRTMKTPPPLTQRSVKDLGDACLMLCATNKSPVEALERIEKSLDQGTVPASAWVKIVLEPTRLSGRKKIFLRILAECFELRGKERLPTDRNDFASEGPPFLTQRSVSDLGEACMILISQSEKGGGGNVGLGKDESSETSR